MVRIRDVREWLFTFPLPPIPVQSIPIPSHSYCQFCNQFPFPWDSHKAFPIPSHSHSRTLHRCSIHYFWAREDSSLNMPLKLTISCVHFYSTENRKIVLGNIISFDLWSAQKVTVWHCFQSKLSSEAELSSLNKLYYYITVCADVNWFPWE